MKSLLLITALCAALPSCHIGYAMAVAAGFYQEREDRAAQAVNNHYMQGATTSPGYNPKP